MLSTIEKIIFLREVPFFEGMTVDQLKILASVSEEEVFQADAKVFQEGEAGGILYVVVNGKVALEREGPRKGSTVRIGLVESLSYFGEMTLFDNSPRTERAISDTLLLRLRREPLLMLMRQYPDLSLKLINVLSRRLREVNDKIASLSTARPRELHKVFDKLE
jgi:CRP/FNR family transcriptional regulator, cyclic AMP receptor protein